MHCCRLDTFAVNIVPVSVSRGDWEEVGGREFNALGIP